MFSYKTLESRIPTDHPIRKVRQVVDVALKELEPAFDEMYASAGRPSIPPEQLILAMLLQIMFTIRSERQLVERIDYDLMFRWFVGLGIDDDVWNHSTFSKNRDRLMVHEIDSGENFHGQKRSNKTHESKTDPDSRLFRKSKGKESKLCHMGHIVTENRNGLIVSTEVSDAGTRQE